MFSWAFVPGLVLLSSVMNNVAASTALQNGVYSIMSLKSGTEVRAHEEGQVLYVSNTYEPSPFETWFVKGGESGYSLRNYGLDMYAFANPNGTEGDFVSAASTLAEFTLTPSAPGSTEYLIALFNATGVWTVEESVDGGNSSQISIRDPTGGIEQRFNFQILQSAT